VIPGTQTAVVVGPAGEIFTDKYGGEFQFHWDQEGKTTPTAPAGSVSPECRTGVRAHSDSENWPEVVISFLEIRTNRLLSEAFQHASTAAPSLNFRSLLARTIRCIWEHTPSRVSTGALAGRPQARLDH
jgi:hypothetical protein